MKKVEIQKGVIHSVVTPQEQSNGPEEVQLRMSINSPHWILASYMALQADTNWVWKVRI